VRAACTRTCDLSVDDLKELVSEFRDLIGKRVGRDIPQDPREQLWKRSAAVFGSWTMSARLGTASSTTSRGTGHRRHRAIDGVRQPRLDCATGVAFTRDPSTGEKGIYGEFLPNAQARMLSRAFARAAKSAWPGTQVGAVRGINEAIAPRDS